MQKIDLSDLTLHQTKILLGNQNSKEEKNNNLEIIQSHFPAISLTYKDDLIFIDISNPEINEIEFDQQATKATRILNVVKSGLINKSKPFSENGFNKLIDNVKNAPSVKPLLQDDSSYRGVSLQNHDFVMAFTDPKIMKVMKSAFGVKIEASNTLDKIKIFPVKKSADNDVTLGKAEKIIHHFNNIYKKELVDFKVITAKQVKETIKEMDKVQSLSTDETSVKKQTTLSTEKQKIMENNFSLKCHHATIEPRDESQKLAIAALREEKLVTLITGNASSGKTFAAVAYAVSELKATNITKIYLSRPIVEAGENLGFQKGTLNEKVDHYMKPLYESLEKLINPQTLTSLFASKTIEIAPLAFMRGRTLENAILIVDEVQNATDSQIRMALSRPDETSRVILTGDTIQNDRTDGLSGLQIALDVLDDMEEVNIVNCTGCFRHPSIAKILDRYAEYDANKIGTVSINKPLKQPANDNGNLSGNFAENMVELASNTEMFKEYLAFKKYALANG